MAISSGTALLGGSLISGIGSLFGAGKGASAATQAADIQAAAAQKAVDAQLSMFNTTQTNLAPYRNLGSSTAATLEAALPGLTTMPTTWGMSTEFSPTMASLEATPGYKFALQQGLQATTNAYAASGLGGTITGKSAGPSGPLAAAQSTYASGLASQTFNQQYQNWLAGQNLQLSQKGQAYGFLAGPTTLGETAAAGQGEIGAQTAAAIGQTGMAGAAASAAGIVGSANAWNQGLSGLGGAASNAAMLYALNNSGMFGSSGGGLAAPMSSGYYQNTGGQVI